MQEDEEEEVPRPEALEDFDIEELAQFTIDELISGSATTQEKCHLRWGNLFSRFAPNVTEAQFDAAVNLFNMNDYYSVDFNEYILPAPAGQDQLEAENRDQNHDAAREINETGQRYSEENDEAGQGVADIEKNAYFMKTDTQDYRENASNQPANPPCSLNKSTPCRPISQGLKVPTQNLNPHTVNMSPIDVPSTSGIARVKKTVNFEREMEIVQRSLDEAMVNETYTPFDSTFLDTRYWPNIPEPFLPLEPLNNPPISSYLDTQPTMAGILDGSGAFVTNLTAPLPDYHRVDDSQLLLGGGMMGSGVMPPNLPQISITEPSVNSLESSEPSAQAVNEPEENTTSFSLTLEDASGNLRTSRSGLTDSYLGDISNSILTGDNETGNIVAQKNSENTVESKTDSRQKSESCNDNKVVMQPAVIVETDLAVETEFPVSRVDSWVIMTPSDGVPYHNGILSSESGASSHSITSSDSVASRDANCVASSDGHAETGETLADEETSAGLPVAVAGTALTFEGIFNRRRTPRKRGHSPSVEVEPRPKTPAVSPEGTTSQIHRLSSVTRPVSPFPPEGLSRDGGLGLPRTPDITRASSVTYNRQFSFVSRRAVTPESSTLSILSPPRTPDISHASREFDFQQRFPPSRQDCNGGLCDAQAGGSQANPSQFGCLAASGSDRSGANGQVNDTNSVAERNGFQRRGSVHRRQVSILPDHFKAKLFSNNWLRNPELIPKYPKLDIVPSSETDSD